MRARVRGLGLGLGLRLGLGLLKAWHVSYYQVLDGIYAITDARCDELYGGSGYDAALQTCARIAAATASATPASAARACDRAIPTASSPPAPQAPPPAPPAAACGSSPRPQSRSTHVAQPSAAVHMHAHHVQVRGRPAGRQGLVPGRQRRPARRAQCELSRGEGDAGGRGLLT